MKLRLRQLLMLALCMPGATYSAQWLPSAPAPWQVSVFSQINDARSLAVDASGRVFVGTRRDDKVWMLEDTNGDGLADKVTLIAKGLNMPNGIAVSSEHLYVVSRSRIDRFPLNHLSSRESWLQGLPDDNHHGWRYAAVGPDGYLYVSIGAPCNVCLKPADQYAVIVRYNLSNKKREVVAQGVRNSVGITWSPSDGTMWFTDNGRDWMGDELPPDELNKKTGLAVQHYGFPFRFGRSVVDPKFGDKQPPGLKMQPPAWEFTAHAAPLGLSFIDSGSDESQAQHLLVAQHGSWNRSTLVGYKVVELKVRQGTVVSQRDFLWGFLDDATVLGRPVDVVTHPTLGILVSDDFAGRIYRVYKPSSVPPESKP